VHIFENSDSGALTIVGSTSDGKVFSWLDLALDVAPIHTQAISSQVSTFAAAPLNGADAPGFVGLLSSESGQIVVLLGGKHQVHAKQVHEQVCRCPRPR
jgi:hypothetical protein